MHGTSDGARRTADTTIVSASTTTYRHAESKQRCGLHENKIDRMRNHATSRPTIRPMQWRSKRAAEKIVRAAHIGARFRRTQLELREIARTFSASMTTSSMLANTTRQKKPASRRRRGRMSGAIRSAPVARANARAGYFSAVASACAKASRSAADLVSVVHTSSASPCCGKSSPSDTPATILRAASSSMTSAAGLGSLNAAS